MPRREVFSRRTLHVVWTTRQLVGSSARCGWVRTGLMWSTLVDQALWCGASGRSGLRQIAQCVAAAMSCFRSRFHAAEERMSPRLLGIALRSDGESVASAFEDVADVEVFAWP